VRQPPGCGSPGQSLSTLNEPKGDLMPENGLFHKLILRRTRKELLNLKGHTNYVNSVAGRFDISNWVRGLIVSPRLMVGMPYWEYPRVGPSGRILYHIDEHGDWIIMAGIPRPEVAVA
jgi:hypothetical protein